MNKESRRVISALQKAHPEMRAGRHMAFPKTVTKTLIEAGASPDDVAGLFNFSPDAFAIYGEEREVVCVEVDDHHATGREKLYKYRRLAWTLDEYDWGLGLLIYDIFGNPRMVRNLLYLDTVLNV